MNFRQDLEEDLFDNNSKCEDCECDSAYVKHSSSDEYPVQTVRTKETKKKSGENESGKLTTTTTTTTNNYLCSMLLNTLEIHLLRNAVAVRSLLERTDKT